MRLERVTKTIMKKTFCFRVPVVVSLLVSSLIPVKAIAVPMSAAPVKLAWNASPDSAVTGYALYYHLADSSVANRLDLGPAQSATVSDLEAGSDYLFYVVAYDAAGVESPPSNSLLYSPPAMSRLRIAKMSDSTMSIQFRAAAGALCRVEYASTLTSPQWQTLGTATADANGNVLINDRPSGRPALRFYRGVRQ